MSNFDLEFEMNAKHGVALKYNPEWLGATGYFDNITEENMNISISHGTFYPVTANDGRRLLIFLLNREIQVIFERYVDSKVLVSSYTESVTKRFFLDHGQVDRGQFSYISKAIRAVTESEKTEVTTPWIRSLHLWGGINSLALQQWVKDNVYVGDQATWFSETKECFEERNVA